MAKKKLGLAEQYEVYLANAVAFPGLLELLRVTLGDSISIEAIMDLGVGYAPYRHAWVFPERNPKGDVTGFTFRHVDTGSKMCVEGGKRGLTYVYNHHYARNTGVFKPGAHNWTRTTDSLPCPVCGKKKYCMVDKTNPQDPGVVWCTKVGTGSKRATSNGWIHELKPGGDKCGEHSTVLTDSELPYLIVEGGSDVIAGHTLGFTTLGRPSNTGGVAQLRRLPTQGHPLIVIGENDKQINALGKEIFPGYDGAKKVCMEMRDVSTISMIMPPKEYKDLLVWVREGGLTQEQLLAYIEANAQNISVLSADMFESDDPLHIADKFLRERYTQDDTLTLRLFNELWLGWNGERYKEVNKSVLRGGVYSFIENKQAVCSGANGDPVVKMLKSSARKVSDITDAFSRWCPVTHDMPYWLDGVENKPPVDSLIAFKNGLLDVDEYCKGNVLLHKPDPKYFSAFALPYAFDADLESPLAEAFFEDVYEGDKERIRLQQQWFGYNLVPDTHMQKFMLMVGVPRSGKSTIIEMMQHMIGTDQCHSIRFENLATEFGRQPLLGKMCCFIGDTRSPGKGIASTCMEQLLRITGEDTVGVNRKHSAEVAATLKCRFTFAMNELPFFIDSSNAMASRMLILNFNKSYIGREDYSLRGRLRDEAKEGKLMNWALRGLRDLREEQSFSEPAAARETLEEFIEMASPVATFVKECCDYDAKYRESTDKMFDVWCKWAENAGYMPGVKVHFGRKLTSATSGRVTRGRTITDAREHAYVGIALNKHALDKYLGGE